MNEATYKFEYAIQRLRDAINYSEQVRDYTQIRIWVNRVEVAYNADIKAEQELTANANEGAKLMYSLTTGDDVIKLLNDWQLNAIAEEEVNHQDDLLPCGHSSEHLGGFGGCNPNGSCMLCEEENKNKGSKVINLNGYKATATASWRERHLNES